MSSEDMWPEGFPEGKKISWSKGDIVVVRDAHEVVIYDQREGRKVNSFPRRMNNEDRLQHAIEWAKGYQKAKSIYGLR